MRPLRVFVVVIKAWEETRFTTLNHREQPGVYILGALEEILMVLEDNQVRKTLALEYELSVVRQALWCHPFGIPDERERCVKRTARDRDVQMPAQTTIGGWFDSDGNLRGNPVLASEGSYPLLRLWGAVNCHHFCPFRINGRSGRRTTLYPLSKRMFTCTPSTTAVAVTGRHRITTLSYCTEQLKRGNTTVVVDLTVFFASDPSA